jgi:hypothetical protein
MEGLQRKLTNVEKALERRPSETGVVADAADLCWEGD